MPSPFDIIAASIDTAKTNLEAAQSSLTLAMLMLEGMRPDEAQPGASCKHAQREDISSMGGAERWRCLDCGHMHQAE